MKTKLGIELFFDIKHIDYNFYDEIHQFARLTIVVTYLNEKIELDVLPF